MIISRILAAFAASTVAMPALAGIPITPTISNDSGGGDGALVFGLVALAILGIAVATNGGFGGGDGGGDDDG